MAIDIPLLSLCFQGSIMLLFLGSFFVAVYNLMAFKQANITNALKSVMDDYWALTQDRVFEKYHEDLKHWRDNLAQTELNPLTFYYQHLNYVARVGQFYEMVGVLVRKRLVDFDLLFEVLPFPDKFWQDTREFREVMQQVTYSDFWYNFEFLETVYQQARKQRPRPNRRLIPKSVKSYTRL